MISADPEKILSGGGGGGGGSKSFDYSFALVIIFYRGEKGSVPIF